MPRPRVSVSASNPVAQATFSRNGQDAQLALEIQVPTVTADLSQKDFETAIRESCDREILLVQTAIVELGNQLANQLDDSGKRANLRDDLSWNESRSWQLVGRKFQVSPTRHRINARITASPETSDADLARQAIRIQLEGRIRAIRDVYRVVVDDVKKSLTRRRP